MRQAKAIHPITRHCEPPDAERRSYTIHSVDNAINILEMFCEEGRELRLTEISDRLNMGKSQVFRLLATFEGRGYVRKSEANGSYRLGLPAYSMWGRFQNQVAVSGQAHVLMNEIHRRLNEAVYLAVSDGTHLLLLDMIDTTQAVHAVSLIGKCYPLSATVAGQVILAFGSGSQEADGSPHAPARLKQLDEFYQQGGGSDYGVLGEGIASVAVPLAESNRQITSSLCVVGPQYRFSQNRISSEILPTMLEVAAPMHPFGSFSSRYP